MNQRKGKDAFDQGFAQGVGAWNQMQGDALNSALDAYSQGIKDSISNGSGGFTNQSIDVQQGFVAEAHHVGSFNVEASAKGLNNHRATRNSGVHNDPVADAVVTTPDGTKTTHQMKFYKDGQKTAAALSPERYDTVDSKIVPSDQVPDVRASASKQAARNQDTRPSVSKSNQHTAETATDKLASKDGKVSSTGLKRKGDGSAEELAKRTKKNNEGPEYGEKARVRTEFNSMQYHNAAKGGAIAGAASEGVSILIDILRSDKPMTMDDCMDAAKRLVASSARGAGNALLITGIQHAGQAMVDAAKNQGTKAVSQAMGKHLAKGNVAAAVAQITVQLAQNLYRFSQGEIDNLQLASSTVGGTMQIVGSSLSYTAGAAVGTWLGASVPAAISGYAIAGTTLGAVGVMASGMVFGIGFALAAGAYVNHFSTEGRTLASNQLNFALEQLNGGKIDMSTYVGKVATMSEIKFQWSDLLPFSGAISVLAEYGQRKNQLQATRSHIQSMIDALPAQERAIMQELADQYRTAIQHVEQQYMEARASITEQALDQFDTLSEQLSEHLEQKFVLFAPIRRSYIEQSELMDLEVHKAQEDNERAKVYKRELLSLQTKLNTFTTSDKADRALKEYLRETIVVRMKMLIPHKTGWDEACEFLELQ